MTSSNDVAEKSPELGDKRRVSRSKLSRLSPYTLFPPLAVLAFVMAYPLFMVLYGSFRGGPPGVDAPFSFDGYVRGWTDWGVHKALITTFALAVPRIFLGLSLATILAWIITRTNTPMRSMLEQLVWFRFFLPMLPITMSWVMIAGGKTGFVHALFGVSLDIRSYWGIVLMSTMIGGSLGYFFIAPAFRSMDAALEESSRVSGASNMTTLRRITAPLLAPAILGAASLYLLFLLSSYETEMVLGSGKGIYVFTTYIWHTMSKVPVDYPQAMALSSVFMLFVSIVILLNFKLLGGRQFTTVTGRGFGLRPTDLGTWKWVTFAGVIFYFLFASILPLAVLIAGTFQGTWGVTSSSWTLRHWQEALSDSEVLRSVRNTLFLGLLVATASAILYSFMSYGYLRTKLRGRHAIEVLTWVPRMAPGIVLAVGVVWAVLGGIPGIRFLYGTLFLMAIVVVVENTPTGMRITNGGMVQLGAELEESARISGAGWFQTVRRIVLPLLAPTLLSSWLLGFLAGTRALLIVMFLYLPSSRVLSLDIFERWQSIEWEEAAVLGVILTAITVIVAAIAQVVAARQRKAMDVTV